MRAGGAPVAALLLIFASLVITVTSEDIYWEGEEDASNEFLEVKEHESSLSDHLTRIKRQWWWFSPSSTSTTSSPVGNEDTTEDSAGEGVVPSVDDEGGDGSGAHSPLDTSEPKERTLRVTFVAMQPYRNEYSNRDSSQFQNFSKSLANAVNKIYEERGRNREISGTQRASLVRIQSQVSEEFSCKVTLDIVTTGYYEMEKIGDILRNHIRDVGRLDGVALNQKEFSATVIDPASNELCPPDWIRCDAGSCLPGSVRCNGVRECSDGTDEAGCPTDVSVNEIPTGNEDVPQPDTESPIPGEDQGETYVDRECQLDELRCDHTRCVALAKRCDGDNDCDDGSDEQNCSPIIGGGAGSWGKRRGGPTVKEFRRKFMA